MLRRLGKKTKLLPELLPLFPDCSTFVDLFMGSGAVSFAMVSRCKYIFANDIENDIFNLYQVLLSQKDELVKQLQIMPIHNALFQHWRKNEEADPVIKAVRFLFLSNFSVMGTGNSLCIIMQSDKKVLLSKIENVFKLAQNIKFTNCDFRDILKKIVFKDNNEINKTFLYADPPYLNTGSNYNTTWTEQDTRDLFKVCMDSGLRFAISEFDNPVIIEIAKSYDLNINYLKERQTLKSRNTEILITNYHANRQRRLF